MRANGMVTSEYNINTKKNLIYIHKFRRKSFGRDRLIEMLGC
jgi:hypothetical protein